MIRLLCVFLLSLVAWHAGADGLAATVDRTTLNEGETLDLILESDDTTLFGKPDLTPLDTLFEVLGTRQVNRISTLGGRSSSSTQWIVTLQPKQTGNVVIPPLQLGSASSQPITLRVQPASASATKNETGKLAPIFIDASLDRESVYVQAQTVLTLRIYHSVSLYNDSSLTPLQMPDARVEQLGDAKVYEKVINGVRHGVIEVRYAIYPQKSGELTIPSQTFSATPVARAEPGDFFGGRPGRLTRVQSPEIPLSVKGKPDSYPVDAPWLPAASLALSEAWNPAPERATVGDSLTRSIMLRAEGLSSAQLPPLPPSVADGLRRYPDQPQLSNQAGETGLTGSREEREALVPERSGRIELPELDVVWWNTTEDRLEHSSLPARVIQVNSNPALDAENPVGSDTPTLHAESSGPAIWPWQSSTLLFFLTTLLGFGLWWRARRQPAILPSVTTGPSPRTLLDDLKRACQANDTQATRQALDAWARQQPETLAQMAVRFEPLSEALDGLNGALYSETGQHWQGESLWQAIRTLPPLDAPVAQEPSPLPPLYPR